MDPKEVKLTTRQKIVPLLQAINKEIPWQFVLFGLVVLSLTVFFQSLVPVMVDGSAIGDFLLRRVVVGIFMLLVNFLVLGFISMVVVEKILPVFKRISKHYEETSLEAKKKVLDNVIEDEVLDVH